MEEARINLDNCPICGKNHEFIIGPKFDKQRILLSLPDSNPHRLTGYFRCPIRNEFFSAVFDIESITNIPTQILT